MTHRYLNGLSFEWKISYSDPQVGFWWFNCLDHPHPQWTTVGLNSNPMWYTAWGIQALLNQWMVKTEELFPSGNGQFIQSDPDRHLVLYKSAVDAETNRDTEIHRNALDDLIYWVRCDLYLHMVSMSQLSERPVIQLLLDAKELQERFDDAFS